MRVDVPTRRVRPFILGVLQRIEYRYADKDRLIAPKLDGEEKMGTFGMIDLTVNFWHPSIPGRMFHPIDNQEEATWWLNFYRENEEFVRAFFVPRPDGRETGVFRIPELGEFVVEDPANLWYLREAGPYSR